MDRDFDKASDNLLADFVGTGWPATLEVLDTIFNRAEEHLFDEAASPASAWRDGLELKDYNSTVYTPKGSAVPVTVMTWEFSGSTIAAGNAEIEAAYPNAVRETNTSRRYNCHSYAWYSLSTSNDKWMNTPGDDKYWQDGSYIPAPIIAGARVSYPASADHSAIAISASEYRSKWGQYPRMRHAPCYTPYTPCTPQNGYVRAPTVTVTGPSSREPNQSGTWTCSVSGGVPPFSYSWFKSYGGGGYTNLGTGSSKTASHPTSFNMVCDVTNSSGFVGSDFQFVNVDGDPDGPIFE